jgi:hypothetical protein
MKERKRQSQRRWGYDYASPGGYFVTVRTTDRRCLFGQVASGGIVLNDASRMTDQARAGTPMHYSGIGVEAVQVMPNHIHGILVIEPAGPGSCAPPVTIDPSPSIGLDTRLANPGYQCIVTGNWAPKPPLGVLSGNH